MNVTRNPGSSVGKRWPADIFISTLKLSYYDWNTIWKDIKVFHPFNMNVYNVVTQICSYNYTYCFELSFENLTPPNMQLQLYILPWVIFYQSCCIVSKQNWFKNCFHWRWFLLPGLILTETWVLLNWCCGWCKVVFSCFDNGWRKIIAVLKVACVITNWNVIIIRSVIIIIII